MRLAGVVVPPVATLVASERPTGDVRPTHGGAVLLRDRVLTAAGVRNPQAAGRSVRLSIGAPASRSRWLHVDSLDGGLGTGSRGTEPTQHPHKSGSQTLITGPDTVKRLRDWHA